MSELVIPEDLEQYREAAEKLADSMYKPHRFGDTPAWFNACVRLAQQRLYLEAEIDRIASALKFIADNGGEIIDLQDGTELDLSGGDACAAFAKQFKDPA